MESYDRTIIQKKDLNNIVSVKDNFHDLKVTFNYTEYLPDHEKESGKTKLVTYSYPKSKHNIGVLQGLRHINDFLPSKDKVSFLALLTKRSADKYEKSLIKARDKELKVKLNKEKKIKQKQLRTESLKEKKQKKKYQKISVKQKKLHEKKLSKNVAYKKMAYGIAKSDYQNNKVNYENPIDAIIALRPRNKQSKK